MRLDFKKQKLFFFFLILSFLGLVLKLLFLYKHSTAFTYDQARDLLDLREMWLLKKPRLIGANTSLHGVFYGPFWYWLCFPFYLLTGGHPLTNLIPLFLIAFFSPLAFFYFSKDKKLGIFMGALYIFSYTFFTRSIVALNTNPVIYFAPLFLIFLARFYQEKKAIFLWITCFLAGSCFHFEPIIGILWPPILLASSLALKKGRLLWEKKRAAIFFLIPFLPQAVFELRHKFLQTKALLTLLTGGGSSLTPGSGDLTFRFFDRLKLFKNIFLSQTVGSLPLALFCFGATAFFIFKFLKGKVEGELYFLGSVSFVSLVLVFVGFVLYPYALWPWYLETIDALMLTLIGLAVFFLLVQGRKAFCLSSGILVIFLLLNLSRYLPWPLEQGFSSDPANLRTRLQIVDLIYKDTSGAGFKVFTFAPYVYDYPYQYLIWWRAKEKYQYLPEEYTYLSDQPAYVPAKTLADSLIPQKPSECHYLIIEPYESQKAWYFDWRGRFPDAQKTWEVGRTRVEKLCQD